MALDPVVLNPGAGGDSIGTDNIGGVNYEIVKVAYGGLGSITSVEPTTPLPVTLANTGANSTPLNVSTTISDTAPATQNITIVDSGSATVVGANGQSIITGSPTANSAASFALATGFDTIRVQVTGTWTGTIASEQSIDGGITWVGVGLHQGAYTVGSWIANFVGGANIAGVTNYRIRATAAITGTAVVKVIQSVNNQSVYIANASPAGTVSSLLNSTTATLLAGAVFTGTAEDVSNFSEMRISVFSNVASATDGLSIQQSSDGTNWDITDTYTIAAATGKTFVVPRQCKWFRIVYTNGGTNQASFRLASILNRTATIGSSQRSQDAYTNETDLEEAWAFNSMWNGSTWDRMRGTIANGLQVDVTRTPGMGTDNTQLYSNTIVSAGAITGIDTTGYTNIVLQLTGTWVGSVILEGSNDNTNWVTLLTTPVGEITQDDFYTTNGIYTAKAVAKYFRINVLQYVSGSIVALALGRTVEGTNAADRISFAMDKGNNMPLYTSDIDTKKDITKALIPSDAPAPIYGFANAITGANSILSIIDTTGYQSISVQVFGTFSATFAFTVSNDGVNYLSVQSYSMNATLATVSAVSALTAGVYVVPCAAKFLKVQLTSYTSGTVQMIAYLRQQPVPVGVANNNLALVGGFATVNGGLNGVLSVGGNVANGVAPTANPLSIAGIDTSALTRRLLTDTSGRLLTASVDQTGTTRPVASISPSNSYNVAAAPVMDVSAEDGNSIVSLLSQILLELKINSQYMYELPSVLQKSLSLPSDVKPLGFGNEPIEFRNEQSLFAV